MDSIDTQQSIFDDKNERRYDEKNDVTRDDDAVML